MPVAVLNNTTIQGLAATYSAKVRSAGWTNVTIGNWRGSIAGNTVYFPPQFERQAKLLATTSTSAASCRASRRCGPTA